MSSPPLRDRIAHTVEIVNKNMPQCSENILTNAQQDDMMTLRGTIVPQRSAKKKGGERDAGDLDAPILLP
jgi:hypothetical protein